MDDFYVTIPYGLVVLGGGVAGYVKRGSVASLAAAAGFGGAPLLAGALSIWAFTGGHSSSLFATVRTPICVEASVDVTLYDELFVTSINEKHILSPLQARTPSWTDPY
ncbi:hypothetical protein CFC21_029324 [Triticum aestivum]|uniref:Uncharacterized protein n=2 Tax=Triticum aestivum TaxID=4565 RepID=A0A9R1JFD5_WHEAT|nr:hypothetical protein CFC21_029324 [Triticum aestivum]